MASRNQRLFRNRASSLPPHRYGGRRVRSDIARYLKLLDCSLCHEKDLLTRIPYKETSRQRCIGYEDWSWNQLTIEAGALHKVIRGTGHAIRQKPGSRSMLWIMNEAGSIPFLTNMMRTHIAKRAAEGSIGARLRRMKVCVTGTLGKIDETLVEDLASESRVILTGNSDYCKLLVKASQGFVGVASAVHSSGRASASGDPDNVRDYIFSMAITSLNFNWERPL